MEQPNKQMTHSSERRDRLHELLIALIHQQEDMQLMDAETPRMDQSGARAHTDDPARWLDRNRRVLKKYQALVRSAITLESLMEAESI